MKKTSNHNSFDRDLLTYYFEDCWECWYCKQNTNDCFHHIMGRGAGDSKVESSILNSAPMCNHKCHLPNHGEIRANSGKYLIKTIKYLVVKDYKFIKKDIEFYNKYIKYYEI